MTVGVYGLVAAIVKLDDLGLHLSAAAGTSGFARLRQRLGGGILAAAPWLMKGLSVAGTAAMFLVGGGILSHGIGPIHHWVGESVASLDGWVGLLGPTLIDAVVGVVAGALAVLAVSLAKRLRG
jgi:predicted DNA repair protein MutK